MPSPPDSPSTFPRLVGRAVERVEDAALLTGRGRFADDVGERPGTAHAAVLRSPHAHAEVVSLDATAALSMPEVVTVLTGEDVAAWSRPFIAGVKQPMRHYALAVDRVRYTGEPVAVVVARDRYGAEDALERIEVEYRELAPVVDPVAAAAPGAPLLHRDVGSNVVSDRRLRYGDPDAAFASAAHRVAISVRYPRNACTPIEGFVVVAEHLGEDGYDVLSNFQGPFTLHPVMALALGVAGARLRLRSPRDSGGSFGVKQAVFPYVVAMCLRGTTTSAADTRSTRRSPAPAWRRSGRPGAPTVCATNTPRRGCGNSCATSNTGSRWPSCRRKWGISARASRRLMSANFLPKRPENRFRISSLPSTSTQRSTIPRRCRLHDVRRPPSSLPAFSHAAMTRTVCRDLAGIPSCCARQLYCPAQERSRPTHPCSSTVCT